jgi:dienelactone hydrolase
MDNRLDRMSDVTSILSPIEQGETHAGQQLLPPVSDGFRKRAAQKPGQEKPDPALQARAALGAGVAALLVVFLFPAGGFPGEVNQDLRPMPPFLDLFRGHGEVPIKSEDVHFLSAVGTVGGYLTRPATEDQLPAVLLLPGENGLTAWMKDNGRDLAGIGYVVLAVDLDWGRTAGPPTKPTDLADEQVLARLWAAIRWLKRRPDVQAQRVGVVGWAGWGRQALALAAATPVQACAICDTEVQLDPALVAGLRGTPVFAAVAGKENPGLKNLTGFRQTLQAAGNPQKILVYEEARPGFLEPSAKAYAHSSAERAWVELYEFLGKYVEDAPTSPATGSPSHSNAVATIADIMRAVNSPTGLLGVLDLELAQAPSNQRQWDRVRAQAALIAESSRLLPSLRPQKGPRGQWEEQARAFARAAGAVVASADERNYDAVRRSLQSLRSRCQACHRLYR